MKPTFWQSLALLAAAVITLAACGASAHDNSTGISSPSASPSCTSAQLLTVSPLAYGNIYEISPLGNLNPTGHVFPTDHMYFYTSTFTNNGTTPAAVVSPGAVTVTAVVVQRRLSPPPAYSDYSVTFFPCADVAMIFGHVTSLSDGFQARVGNIDGSCNPPYTTGGITVQQCYKNTNITLAAGDAIGTAGGPSTGGLDFGAYDRRTRALAFVNGSRWSGGSGEFGQPHTACPLDYFTPQVRDALRAKLGRGGQPRTIEPRCGEIMQDVASSVQGRWFYDASEHEDAHLALVHDNVDPTTGVFSVGSSVPSLPSGTYSFAPSTTGKRNLDFRLANTVGMIYCYEITFPSGRHIFVQLVNASRIRIEGSVGGSCGAEESWSLSAGAVEFSR